MFKNFLASVALTIGYFLFFRNVEILHNQIVETRKNVKAYRDIGWTPKLNCSPRMQDMLERFVLHTK